MTQLRFPFFLSALACMLLVSLSAIGETGTSDPSTATVRISGAWARLQPPSSPMSAAYLEIENLGDSADALIGAKCSCARAVEFHIMTEKDGMMTMRKVERFDLAPGSVKKLEPGGAHLMLMGLTAPLTVDRALEIELVFESAGKIEVSVPVQDRRRMKP